MAVFSNGEGAVKMANRPQKRHSEQIHNVEQLQFIIPLEKKKKGLIKLKSEATAVVFNDLSMAQTRKRVGIERIKKALKLR